MSFVLYRTPPAGYLDPILKPRFGRSHVHILTPDGGHEETWLPIAEWPQTSTHSRPATLHSMHGGCELVAHGYEGLKRVPVAEKCSGSHS